VPFDSPFGTLCATRALDVQVTRNGIETQRPDMFLRHFYRAPAICRINNESTTCRYWRFLFPFFLFSGNRLTLRFFDSLLRSLSHDQPCGLSARPWPHFEYRTLAYGRWGDRRLSIHSIKFNSFNCVKHERVEYFLYFRARARGGDVDGGQEQRLFGEN